MSPVFRYCIHRTDNGDEVVVAVEDASAYIAGAVLGRWRDIPARKKLTTKQVESAITRALEEALDDAVKALRDASVRA
jgi:hypothetical protein